MSDAEHKEPRSSPGRGGGGRSGSGRGRKTSSTNEPRVTGMPVADSGPSDGAGDRDTSVEKQEAPADAQTDASARSEPTGAGKTDAGRLGTVLGEVSAQLAERARVAATYAWRHAVRLSLRGVRVTRPLEVALRATGLAVAAFAPLWPLFGSPPDGWWNWILATLANAAIGFGLFAAGEVVRKIDEVHREVVASRESNAAANVPEPTP